MTPDATRAARYVIPSLYGVALLVGIFVGQFVIIAIIGALVTSILYSGIARANSGSGRGRQRNRNRKRNRP
jgi:hypothetical protein